MPAMTLLIFILILSILVLVHEFGHFIVAKRSGIRVEEFGLGLPPRIIGKKIGETLYSFNLLPFGGFVKLTGEDDTEITSKNDPKSFVSKRAYVRAAILMAGVTMNLILAIVVFQFVLASNNYKSLYLPLFFDHTFRFGETETANTVVASYTEDSAGKEAGIEVGEAIIEINDVPVYSINDVRSQVKDKAGREIKVLLMDLRRQSNGEIRSVNLVPLKDEEGNGIIGVYMTKAVTISYANDKVSAGVLHSYNMMSYSVITFANLIKASFEARSVGPVSEGVAGPVGIYSVVGNILSYSGSKVVLSLLDLVALMSLSLAFLNIMPFPALDGGRLGFVVLEMLRGGKKVSPNFEASVHKWGMIFLLGLIVLVTFKDVFKILS